MDNYIHSITISMVILGALSLDNNATRGAGTQVDMTGTEDRTGGQWGPWTEWSLCGKTCGYGTQYRLRRCHRLKQDNVSCEGDTKQFKICHDRECPPHHQDYRSIECAKHDHIYYGNKRYRWVPYINDQLPCELSCKSMGYGYYARFKTTVEDGVTCNEGNTATCFNGTCLKSGCDGILGSGSKEDICGVCGGRGDTCRIITGIYTRTHLTYRGYNIVAVIPAGARAINITEIGRSKNHLALSTQLGYFLNGHLRLQAEGEVRGAGTVFTYKRGRSRNGCRGECLTADGPLDVPLRVELIYFGRNPGIMYSYAIPNNDDGRGGQGEERRLGPDESDTEPLSLGSKILVRERPNYVTSIQLNRERQQLQQRGHQDTDNNNNNHNNHQQQHHHQRQQDSNAPSRDPNKHRKPGQQHTHSSRSGSSYTRNNNVTRRKLSEKDILERRRRIRMDEGRRRDSGQTVIAPAGRRPSQSQQWYKKTGGDSTDVQYRHYYHTNALDGLGDVAVKTQQGTSDNERPRSSYTQSKPSSSSSSSSSSSFSSSSYIDNNVPLPQDDQSTNNSNNNNSSTTNSSGSNRDQYNNRPYRRRLGSQDGVFSWRISGFTDCTEPCGGGLQETRVVCIKSDSQLEVMDEDCDVTAKPETTTVVCNNQPCEPSWSLSQWSSCSVSCGRGLRRREVDCQQRISPTLTIPVTINKCPSPRPQSRQYCQLDPCYSWRPSNWTQCSAVCGFGQRSRTLTCIDTQGKEVKGHLCTGARPTTEEICDMGSCAQGWFHSKWTKECSAECGRGHYTRKVYCSAPDGSPLDENKCGGEEKKPRGTKTCKAPLPCGGMWFAGPWSKCNDTCGSNAVRRREVLCIKQHGKRVKGITKDHNCDESKRPADSEQCPPMPDCQPQWYMMAWSNCSKECDTGVRTREVTCLDVNLKQNPDCDKNKKPSTRQSCNTFPCEQNFQELTLGGGMTHVLQQDGTIIDVPSCEDKNGAKWCRLVSQARLCSYYKEKCCRTCGQHHHKGKG